MIVTGPQIISELRKQLHNEAGRHLYAVLGTYQHLKDFEQIDLLQAQGPDSKPFPVPVNFNRGLLDCIEDEELRKIVRDESRRPKTVENKLDLAFDQLLRNYFLDYHFMVLKQVELMVTYHLDMSKLRTYATNQNHILLLLPGQKAGNQIVLFHEAEQRFQSQFPGFLIADNNLWELKP